MQHIKDIMLELNFFAKPPAKPVVVGSTRLLPAWAGVDIAGAANGAMTSGIAQYSVTGDINWGSVGVSAFG